MATVVNQSPERVHYQECCDSKVNQIPYITMALSIVPFYNGHINGKAS